MIHEYLKSMQIRNGSDLHLIAGDPPRKRINGDLVELDQRPLEADELTSDLTKLMAPAILERYQQKHSADFAHAIPDIARFRVNVFRQLKGIGAVFRSIPSKAMTMKELGLPPALGKLVRANNGLILVTGKTGSGKSTTLAAIIDSMNEKLHGHILTIEDPIEFEHRRKSCLISQREIGAHSPSFSAALHSALREDPDVILVGEMRDLETMSIAMTAAEMGILVLGTLHTNGAAATIDRVINIFPADKQDHIRNMLSTSLRGIVSQQLVKKRDGSGRLGVHEILFNTPAVANLIRQGKMDQIETVLQSSASEGMCTMDNSLKRMFDRGLISGTEAYLQAIDKSKFEEYKDLD